MKPHERLRAEREALGLSQKAFAELVGASKSTQIRWESGETAPGIDALLKWADFGLDWSYVLTGVRSIKVAVTDLAEQQRATEVVDTFLQLPDEDQHAIQTHANALLRAAIATGTAKSVRRRLEIVDDAPQPSSRGAKFGERAAHARKSRERASRLSGKKAPDAGPINKVTAKGKRSIAIGSIHGGTQHLKSDEP